MKATVTAKAKNIEQIKLFLSRQKETYKVPYEVHLEDRPETVCILRTSNDLNFLPLDRRKQTICSGDDRYVESRSSYLTMEAESKAYIEQAWAERNGIVSTGKCVLRIYKGN